MFIIKRDGRIKEFEISKVHDAIKGATKDAYPQLSDEEINNKVDGAMAIIEPKITKKEKIKVEDVQDIIEKSLKKYDPNIKETFSAYRKDRTHVRDMKSDLMGAISKIAIETDRDNANVGNNFSSKLLRIASESNKWCVLANMPKEMAKAHETGDLHFHDLDSYNLTVNCLHVPTKKMLENGFNTGYGTINKPKRIETAAELSCILLQSSQNR